MRTDRGWLQTLALMMVGWTIGGCSSSPWSTGGLREQGTTSEASLIDGAFRYDEPVIRRLRSSGLAPIGPPSLSGPNYVVEAINQEGTKVQVVVATLSGDIISVKPRPPGTCPKIFGGGYSLATRSGSGGDNFVAAAATPPDQTDANCAPHR